MGKTVSEQADLSRPNVRNGIPASAGGSHPMRRTFAALVIGLALWSSSGSAQGQVMLGGPVSPYRVQAYYGAPGSYGTTYGYSSYGLRQTYTTFSSPYGAGYSYGYPPATYLPGPYGVGLWKPGGSPASRVWRTPYYGTYALPTAPRGVPLPPVGVYAPAFGPGVPPMIYGR